MTIRKRRERNQKRILLAKRISLWSTLALLLVVATYPTIEKYFFKQEALVTAKNVQKIIKKSVETYGTNSARDLNWGGIGMQNSKICSEDRTLFDIREDADQLRLSLKNYMISKGCFILCSNDGMETFEILIDISKLPIMENQKELIEHRFFTDFRRHFYESIPIVSKTSISFTDYHQGTKKDGIVLVRISRPSEYDSKELFGRYWKDI